MTTIEAVYADGVFKPLGEVKLPEHVRVRLQIEILVEEDVPEWLCSARALRQQLFEKYGYFPDSAIDIAEDRRR